MKPAILDEKKEDLFAILNQLSSIFNTYIDKNVFVTLKEDKA